MAAKLEEMLVVSDIDGTLLQAGYGIPKENIEAIDEFAEKGGRFTVCTGRSASAVRRYAEWLNFSAPAILCNGAVIYDYKKNKIVFEKALKPTAVEIIKETLRMFPEIGAELHNSNGIVVVRQNDETTVHTLKEHIPFVLADIDTIRESFNKALFMGPEQKVMQLSKYIEKKKKTDDRYADFDFVASSAKYFEMIPSGVNKGFGLRKLAELLGVDIKNTVAIGDYYNDIEMFEAAGYTAAVSDAPQDIRAAVDVTVKSCLQGGVAELLNSLESLCDGYVQMRLDM